MTQYTVRDYGNEGEGEESEDGVPISRDHIVNDVPENYNTTSLWWWLDKARDTGRKIALYDEANDYCILDWS
jgi:hypothetical protein